MAIRRSELRDLEGQQINIALVDGSRVDDCTLVSAGRGGAANIWVFTGGDDAFLRYDDVVDLWTTSGSGGTRAA
jgi:hypothetical protein